MTSPSAAIRRLSSPTPQRSSGKSPDWNRTDFLDLDDIVFGAGTTASYSGNSSTGTLTVSDAQSHIAHIALLGNYTGATFSTSSDGHGGTLVVDPLMSQDLAIGEFVFNGLNSADAHSVDVAAENGGVGYVGSLTLDAPTKSNGQDQINWHFNLDQNSVVQAATQTYDVTVTDTHADGAKTSANSVAFDNDRRARKCFIHLYSSRVSARTPS